jgi:hypothetical protein
MKNYHQTRIPLQRTRRHRQPYLMAIPIAALLATLFALPGMSAASSGTRCAELFKAANDLYHRADQAATQNPAEAQRLYRQAVMRYESIVTTGGIHNGKLYYNIGNCYFRIKDIGRAILNYRRAMQYIPNDPNLRQNLAVARRQRQDRIDEAQDTRVFKTLFFWHYDLSTHTRILLFSIFFAAGWLMAILRRFAARSILKWGVVISLGASVLLGGSLATEAVARSRTTPGVIIDTAVTARKGNSEAYAQSFTQPLHAGTEFTVIEKRDNWYYIRLADERTCWIPAKSAQLVW